MGQEFAAIVVLGLLIGWSAVTAVVVRPSVVVAAVAAAAAVFVAGEAAVGLREQKFGQA